MAHLLQKAFAEITPLPDTEQDPIAQMLLAASASERLCPEPAEGRWQIAFAKSQDKPALLADEALAEFEMKDLTIFC